MEIQQDIRAVADGRWQWSVWIAGHPAELNAIDYVEYALHPTFAEPLQRSKDRQHDFRIENTGSGEFEINAHLVGKDGSVTHLQHWLALGDAEAPSATYEEAIAPTNALVSYAAADAQWGQAIQDQLARIGFDAVATDDTLELGRPWKGSIASAVDQAGLVVGIFSDTRSPWVERELSEALEHNVEVVPIAIGRDAVIPDWLRDQTVIDIRGADDLEQALDPLAKNLESSS
jgi:hypothetical protein